MQSKICTVYNISSNPITFNMRVIAPSDRHWGGEGFFNGRFEINADDFIDIDLAKMRIAPTAISKIKIEDIWIHCKSSEKAIEAKWDVARDPKGSCYVVNDLFITKDINAVLNKSEYYSMVENTTDITKQMYFSFSYFDHYGSGSANSPQYLLAPNASFFINPYYLLSGREYQSVHLTLSEVHCAGLCPLKDDNASNVYVTDKAITTEKPPKVLSREEIEKNVDSLIPYAEEHQESFEAVLQRNNLLIPIIAYTRDADTHSYDEAVAIIESRYKRITFFNTVQKTEEVSNLQITHGM